MTYKEYCDRREDGYSCELPSRENYENQILDRIEDLQDALAQIKSLLRVMDVRMNGETNYLCPMPNATKIGKIISDALNQKL